jgi:hypothetical protein
MRRSRIPGTFISADIHTPEKDLMVFYDPEEDESWIPFHDFYPLVTLHDCPEIQKIILWNDGNPFAPLSWVKYCEEEYPEITKMLDDIHREIRRASEDA